MKRYLVKHYEEIFTTDYYEYENHYEEEMVIIDLAMMRYTNDGERWHPIEEDEL